MIYVPHAMFNVFSLLYLRYNEVYFSILKSVLFLYIEYFRYYYFIDTGKLITGHKSTITYFLPVCDFFLLQKLQTSDPCNVDPCKQSIYVVKGRSRPCSRQLTFLLSSIRVLSTISLIFSFERLSALKTGLKRSVR